MPRHKKRERMASEQQLANPMKLSPATVDALLAYAARASWPSGFLIYQRGSAADGVFVVLDGRVVLRSRVRAGRGFIPWIATAGETFGSEGLSGASRYATEARADEETTTLFLSGVRFRSFLREQPVHATTLVAQLMNERAALLEKLRELTTMSVEQRLVVALVRMATFDGFLHEDGSLALSTGRYRLLCELVGATRESVSLVLGRFTGEQLIERHGNVLLVHPERLMSRFEELPIDDLLALGAQVTDGSAAIL